MPRLFIYGLIAILMMGVLPATAQRTNGCPGLPEPRLTPGGWGRVTPTEGGNYVRPTPKRSGAEPYASLGPGEQFYVIDGPVCADGFAWWLVKHNALVGWTAEGNSEGYWLEVIESQPVETTDSRQIALQLTMYLSRVIYIVNADGTNFHKLVEATGYILEYEWSPDGSQLAYRVEATDDHRSIIYLVPVDAAGNGGEPRLLVSEAGKYGGMQWSPDGSQIGFIKLLNTRARAEDYLWLTYDVESGEQTAQIEKAGIAPHWSPDGELLAYIDRDGESDILYIMDADGDNRRAVAEVIDHSISSFYWSPDSSRLAFLERRDNLKVNGLIHVVEVASGEINTLHQQPDASFGLEWSADGTEILMTRTIGENTDIYALATDGSGKTRRITDDPRGSSYSPQWSPDGTSVLYNQGRGIGKIDAALADAAGGNERTLIQYVPNYEWRP